MKYILQKNENDQEMCIKNSVINDSGKMVILKAKIRMLR